jgi:hypothetical protein
MGTRSRIALALPTGAFRSIYCHWDGYPAYVGRVLTQHHTDFDKVGQLMDLGDLSALREDIGVKHPFDPPSYNEADRAAHEAQYGRMCLAYGRDRDEKDVRARHHKSFRGLAMTAKNSGTEWLYLFMDGQWLFAPVGSKLVRPTDLTILSLRYCLLEQRADLAESLARGVPADPDHEVFTAYSNAMRDIDAQLATIA